MDLYDNNEPLNAEESTVESNTPAENTPETAETGKEEKNDYLDQLKRVQAEFINYKKRVEKQQTEWNEYAIRQIVNDLLPIVDDFEYMFQHHEGSEENMPASAVKMIYTKLIAQLEKTGMETVKTENEIFDPQVHEAIRVEPRKGAQHGEILQVWQKGYLFKGKLLRPARVMVAEPAQD